MAEKIKFVCSEPTTLLFSSITVKSRPKSVTDPAADKFSGTFGLGEKDFKAMIPVMVQCIQSETGGFTGNPNDYYLACMGGATAAGRVMQKAELDAQALRGQGKTDEAFKLMEKATKRADAYKGFAGILTASSKFDVSLAQLMGGAIKDIEGEIAVAQAGKDLFFPGAIVVPSIALQGFRRKKLDDRDGVTAFLQNVLFIRKGPRIDLGGGQASNSEVFGGFQNYSDYDPTAMAPGGGNDFAGFAGGNAGAGQSQGVGSPAPDNAGYQPQGGQAQAPAEQPAW